MRTITRFAMAGIALMLSTGAAFATANVGGRVVSGSDAKMGEMTASFRSNGASSIGAGGVIPLNGSVAADARGNLGAGGSTGSVARAETGSGAAWASTSLDTPATDTSTSASGSATVQVSSLGGPTGAIDTGERTIGSTVASMNSLPFSTGESAPILEVSVAGSAQLVASVP